MKHKLLLSLFVLITGSVLAQHRTGGLSMGYFHAIPMNNLCDIEYDRGNGFSMAYISRQFNMGTAANFSWGVRMDIASMGKRDFNAVPINTPVADMGDMQVKNSMYGLFGLGRFSFGNGRVQPFIEVLAGHRNLHTKQVITAQNPSLNPEYESVSYYNRVVWTKRFSYGGSFGLSYRISPGFSLETSVTYTEGGVGAVMPLKDVSQNEVYMNYPHQNSETDMLLINLGIRFRFGTSSSGTSTADETQPDPPTKTNTRYTTGSSGTGSSSGTTTGSGSSKSDTSSSPPKKKLEVKPSTKPKKSGAKS